MNSFLIGIPESGQIEQRITLMNLLPELPLFKIILRFPPFFQHTRLHSKHQVSTLTINMTGKVLILYEISIFTWFDHFTPFHNDPWLQVGGDPHTGEDIIAAAGERDRHHQVSLQHLSVDILGPGQLDHLLRDVQTNHVRKPSLLQRVSHQTVPTTNVKNLGRFSSGHQLIYLVGH